MEKTITIAGRAFRAIGESTIEHDVWMRSRIRAAGLEAEIRPGESAEDFANRLLDGLLADGRIFEVVGGVIVPLSVEDTAWTPAVAAETADFLRHLVEPPDKAAVIALVAGVLIPFFRSGAVSLKASAPSSSAGAGGTGLAAMTTPVSENGMSSSEASLATTPIARNGSSAGGFATG